ncbi:MAG: hypothetical protein A2X86_13540 [Bdellovibrionales bacterium GWA2_49_15]|nr:MAG: hypothetical protein A2X86_13540 [Bdellovibrionales bacterium GWA2_49_15]
MDDSPESHQLSLPFVQTIRRTGPPSLARALHDGVILSKGKWVICMDSDGNHRPHDLEQLILKIRPDTAGWLVAQRTHYLDPQYTWAHRLFSWFLNTLIQAVCNLPTRDNTFGLFAAPSSELHQLPFKKIFSGHGEYYFRLLSFAHQKNFPLIGVDAIHGIRALGGSDNQPLKRFFSYLTTLLRHYYSLRANLYA